MIELQLLQKLPWPKTLTWSERTHRRTNERRHRPENIMPLYYRRWGVKKTYEVPFQENFSFFKINFLSISALSLNQNKSSSCQWIISKLTICSSEGKLFCIGPVNNLSKPKIHIIILSNQIQIIILSNKTMNECFMLTKYRSPSLKAFNHKGFF